MAKKKKMKPAQAAAARREQTAETIRRDQARERTRLLKKSAQEAQRKANKQSGFRMMVPLVLVAAIIILALVFTIGPGMVIGA